MLRYSAFGLTIDSEIPLGEASCSLDGPADVVLRQGQVLNPTNRSGPDNEFVNIRPVGAFHIRNGSEIVAQLNPDVDPELLRVILSGRMMGYLLRQRGWLPLHASAVQMGDYAVLFAAQTGTGKSTSAAAFHASGFPVLSDDVSPLRIVDGVCLLRPGKARVRLLDDSADVFSELDPDAGFCFDKRDFDLGNRQPAPNVHVKRIYLLETGDEVRIEPLSPLLATTALGRDCFVRLRYAEPEVKVAHLRDCAAIASLMLVRKLVRPKDLTMLRDVIELVKRDVNGHTLT